MLANCFVDTNVLVYFRDASEPEKQSRAADWLIELWKNQLGRLSIQVLNEFYVTVTQKLNPGLSCADARMDIKNLWVWKPVAIDRDVIENGWTIQDQYGFSWRDSLIIAAAQKTDCSILLSEDLQHEQEIDGLTVLNPFMVSIDQIPARTQK